MAPLGDLAPLLQQGVGLAIGSAPTTAKPKAAVEIADVKHQIQIVEPWGQKSQLLDLLLVIPVTSSTLLLQGEHVLHKAGYWGGVGELGAVDVDENLFQEVVVRKV